MVKTERTGTRGLRVKMDIQDLRASQGTMDRLALRGKTDITVKMELLV